MPRPSPGARTTKSSRAKKTAGSARPAPPRRDARPDEIELLRKEHRNFQRLLRLFRAELALFHRGEEPDYGLMRDIMHYMIQFPDRFHHPREDLILKRLRGKAPAIAPFAQDLLREHEEMAAQATELLGALDEIATDAMFSRETIESMAGTYLDELGAHMEKEEATLFPMARRHLTSRDWAAIAVASRRHDDPLFGTRVAPGYRAIFERLSGAGDAPRSQN